MSLTKSDSRVDLLARRPSMLHHAFIVRDLVLVAFISLSLGVLAIWTNSTQVSAWLNTLLPDRFAVLHEEAVRGAAEQLTTSELIATMQDPDPNVRISAAQALGWRRAPEAVDVLLAATYDADSHVQEEAVAALGEIGQIQVLPRLEALQVVQGNSNVQLAALEAQDQLTGRVAADLMAPRSAVQVVAVAPASVAFAVISDDLYAQNHGTWTRIRHLPVSPNGIALGSDGRTMYLATDSPGLYRSKDGGKTWEHGTVGIDSSTPLVVTAAVVNPGNPQQVYVALAAPGVNGDQSSSLGLYVSSDGGVNWVPLPVSPRWSITRKLIFDPATPNFLYGLTDTGLYRLALPGIAKDLASD